MWTSNQWISLGLFAGTILSPPVINNYLNEGLSASLTATRAQSHGHDREFSTDEGPRQAYPVCQTLSNYPDAVLCIRGPSQRSIAHPAPPAPITLETGHGTNGHPATPHRVTATESLENMFRGLLEILNYRGMCSSIYSSPIELFSMFGGHSWLAKEGAFSLE
jgi:hypothetical protein